MTNREDSIFEALADSQRRQFLVSLLDHDPKRVRRLSAVSREMAEAHETFLREYLSSDLELAESDKEYLRMHCVHLPKLAENGFIEWDRDAHIVTKGPRFDELKPFLEAMDDPREARSGSATAPLVRR